MRGFGLLVKGKPQPQDLTRRVPDDIKKRLKKYEKRFSKRIWSNIVVSLDNLRDEDFADVDVNQLVNDLVATYGEEVEPDAKTNG